MIVWNVFENFKLKIVIFLIENVWRHISATTCQIVMLTCQILMSLFNLLEYQSQINICCPVDAIEITTKLSAIKYDKLT